MNLMRMRDTLRGALEVPKGGIFESAVYSAFYNLLSARREEDGLANSAIAETMHAERSVVTKLTSAPTNMKIRTLESLADALNADPIVLLKDRSQGRIFSSIGELRAMAAFLAKRGLMP